MTRPQRVRVSFELTPEEAEALLCARVMCACGRCPGCSTFAATNRAWDAVDRGLSRYRLRAGVPLQRDCVECGGTGEIKTRNLAKHKSYRLQACPVCARKGGGDE
jgi:hypothetical protein